MDEEDIAKLSKEEIQKIERVNQSITDKLDAEARVESQKKMIILFERTPKKRERPTRLLVPRPNTNPKQLATSLTSKAQFQKSAEQQSDLQKQPSRQMTFLLIP